MAAEIDNTSYAVRNIRHYRGDEFGPILFRFKLNGNPIDLTGSTFTMNVINKGDASKTPLLTFAAGLGITPDEVNGEILVYKTSEQMEFLPAGEFVFDLQERVATGQPRTKVRGLFVVEDDTTIP